MFFKVFFAVFPFVVAAIAFALYAVPARLGTRWRSIWLGILLLCASKFLVFDAIGGSMFAPEMSEKSIWVWSWAYSGMCLMAPVAFVALVLRHATRTARSGFWLFLIPVVSWTASFVGVRSGITVPEVRRVDMEFDNLPAELDGYTIALVADVHASAAAGRWRTEAVAAKVRALDPDLVCLAGDYSDGLSDLQFENAAPLCSLRGRDGVVAVTGNHEYYYDTFRWFARYHNAGLDFLSNECVFPRKGLAVAGVDDIVCMSKGFDAPDVDKAFAAATNGEFRILLQHRPHVDWNKLQLPEPQARFDLQLSGHTHGGVAPVMRSAVAMFNGGMVRGLYDREGGGRVYVSSGAGQWSGFPVRFFDDSEIALITLRAKKRDRL